MSYLMFMFCNSLDDLLLR